MRWAVFVVAVVVIFTVFTTVYAASAPSNAVRNLPKWLWVLLCLFVPVLGGLLYITLGRPNSGPDTSGGSRRTIAPDDDPDFLRKLAERMRNKDASDGQ